MLAARPGARSTGAGLGPESSEPRDRARLGPRGSGGGHRPGAYLDMKTYLEKNLEEERQILLQEQKICRNRARKYFVESNRRKKVFEEKRKEQEEREHQIREQILQQRKREFLEVTEKFQRAHIPLSQRKRAAFQKPVPPLEEALRQIQESNSKSEVNLPSSHRPTISWRAIDNALPSSLPKNDHKHQKHLLSKVNCVKEMKENSRTNLATNKDVFQLKLEETQKLLEDQHLSTLQKFCDEVKQITNSETLSSIDSLEAGEHEEIYLTLKKHYTSIHQNSVSLRSANLQSTNVSCFDEDKLSFSKTQRINNWLINLDDPNNNTITPFSDDFQAPYIPHNSDSKDKKQKIAETSIPLSNVISDCDLVGQHKKIKYNIYERNGVRFLKSILKKESKYEHDCFKALVINQGFKLGNEKAAAIRDSIELTKEKGKGAKIPKTLKKLRWFDETGDTKKNTEDNYSLKNRIEISQQRSQPFHIQTKSGITSNIISVPACAVNSADRKEPKDDSISTNVTTLGGPRTDHVLLNCFIPSSDNIAKQAWPSSEKEENKSPLQSSDSKIQKANSERGGTKVIRRTRSAKVQSGFIYTNRKGTVIRPQSASKANTSLQAQSKLIVPHPPPKYPPNIRNSKNIHVAKYQSVMPENSQNMTQDYFNSSHLLPVEHRLIQQNQESSFTLSDICSGLVTKITSLPYCASECQTSAKINHSNGIQKVAQQHGTLYYTQRSPVYEENHQSVTLRTTEEESVPLWKRLPHNILSQNEKAPDSTVRRRKQIIENKQRSLLECKRQNPGSIGEKYSAQVHNFGQSVQLSSSEPKQTSGTSNFEEVSDSTSEFLMAESLVKTLVPENEILTVMNSSQLQKSDMALNKTQPLNICALSIEEQKILQSLNHLNERLQCTKRVHTHLQVLLHEPTLWIYDKNKGKAGGCGNPSSAIAVGNA
nr:centrosomal protein of 126 kDa [Manis javanica]